MIQGVRGGLWCQWRRNLCCTGLFWIWCWSSSSWTLFYCDFDRTTVSQENSVEWCLILKMIHDKRGPKVCTETTCWFSCSFGPSPLSKHNNSLQNNAKVAAPKPFEWILPGFPVVGYTCSPFNCYGTRLPPPISRSLPAFFLLFFTSARPLVFARSPNFIVGHSPMYNSWVTRLFYTPRTDSPVVAPWGGLNQTSL